MARYDLTSFDSIMGENYGGICTLQFAPKEWIDEFPDADAVTGEALFDVSFLPGFDWLDGVCLRDSMEFTEEQVNNEAGSYFQQKLAAVVNKDLTLVNTLMDAMRYKECIVLYKDRNQQKRLIGSLEKGMSFTCRQATGTEVKDKTAFYFEFYHESSVKAMPYRF